MLLQTFHIAAAALNMYAMYYDQFHVELPLPEVFIEHYPWKGRLVFLTFWCLILQTLYYYVAIINDYIGTNAPTPKRSPFIRKFKDSLFSLALPTAMYVSSAFWGIYFIDKKQVFPEEIERAVPVWLNHALHTFVFVNIALEMLLSNVTFPKRKLGLTIIITFNILYVIWYFRIYLTSDTWVYPLFNTFNWVQRIAYVFLSLFISTILYLLGEKMNSSLAPSGKNKVKGN